MATKTKLIDKLNSPKATRWFWIIVAAPFSFILLMLLLIGIGVFGKLPTFEELENPKSNLATDIYSEDGALLGSFFIQNRSYVDYSDLSPELVKALVATEDMRYYSHSGIDFIALARVAVRTLGMGQGQGGGSTITQQVAKNLYPRDTALYKNPFSKSSKLMVSKLKEWLTAIMLEHNYTKEEIIAMYLNTMEYGSNAFGIKSAARTFFNKTPAELNPEESAILVGVVNAPSRYSPVRNPERAMWRRNLVLGRMYAKGYLSRKERDSLQKTQIKLDYRPISHNEGTATYFREMLRMVMTSKRPTRNMFLTDWDYEQGVRQWDTNPIYGWCVKNMKSDGTPYNLYRDGLKIYTTLNAVMQGYAEIALVDHMKNQIQPSMDTQVKRTKRLFASLSQNQINQIIYNSMRQTDRYRELKNEGKSEEKIMEEFKVPIPMKAFSYKGEIDTLMSPYDSILYHKQFMRSSFVAMDPASGHVKAYVGGPNYRYFKYDMAKQGKRQVGSSIKPFVYSFAIDQLGMNPCTPVPDEPVSIETHGGDAWQPKEAGKVEYDGQLKPLQYGLTNSRNNYSAWIMKQAKRPEAVAEYIHRLGVSSYIDPVYALCLGTPDLSLFELVGAYGTFVNQGIFTDPIFVTRIEDRHGNLLASFTPESHDAISEQTAFTMQGMLKSVLHGTAGRLRWMYKFTGEMGGKTGTSQNNSDAWFVGITPHLVAGAWVGGEDRSIHLNSAADGARSALPIYADFFTRVYANATLEVTQKDVFPTPVNARVFNCSGYSGVGVVRPQSSDEFFD